MSLTSLRIARVIIESQLFVAITFRLSADCQALAKLRPSVYPRCCALFYLEKWCYCASRIERKHYPECPFCVLTKGFLPEICASVCPARME